MKYEQSKERREAGEEKKHWPGSKYCYKAWQSGLLDELTTSDKCALLKRKVQQILDFDTTSKILIFTRFVPMLDILQDLFYPHHSIQYNGDMNATAKAGAIAEFTDNPDCRLFLSSHAGAYGCDMFMANYLINLDLHWSAGGADQINGRHDRPSSEFSHVYIRNMITEDTIEVRKLEQLDWKRKVASAVTDGRGADRLGRVQNDVTTLTRFLEETVPLECA
jgi:SNF2 family DNA or RNA helicase